MSTRTSTAPTTGSTPTTSPGGRLRRFAALVRGETTILLRNRTALFTAVVMPLLLAAMFAGFDDDILAPGPLMATALIGTGLLFVVYYTMVTSLVARREQLVLKRLQAGKPTRLEILLAPAVPLWAILMVQSALGIGLAVVLLDAPVAHWWALPLAVAGGAAAWTAIAVWSATWTRTVESAQLTTLPFLLVSLLLSGFSLPLAMLPHPVERIAHWLPLTPVVDLLTLGFAGTDTAGQVVQGTDLLVAAGTMVLPLLLWTVATLYRGLRDFRWEARS